MRDESGMRGDPKKSVRIIQIIFVTSLVPALSGGVWLFFTRPDYGFFWLSLVGLTILGYFLIQILGERGQHHNWFLSVAVLNFLCLTPEVLLRISNFHYETGIQFAYPTSFQRLVPDKDLFWTLPPPEPGVKFIWICRKRGADPQT